MCLCICMFSQIIFPKQIIQFAKRQSKTSVIYMKCLTQSRNRNTIMIFKSNGTPKGSMLDSVLINITMKHLQKAMEWNGVHWHQACRYPAAGCKVNTLKGRATQRILKRMEKCINRIF